MITQSMTPAGVRGKLYTDLRTVNSAAGRPHLTYGRYDNSAMGPAASRRSASYDPVAAQQMSYGILRDPKNFFNRFCTIFS